MKEPTQAILKVTATWTVELNCDCPHCEEYVDVLTAPDCWEGFSFDIAEHGTERTRAVELICPECGKDFVADLEY